MIYAHFCLRNQTDVDAIDLVILGNEPRTEILKIQSQTSNETKHLLGMA